MMRFLRVAAIIVLAVAILIGGAAVLLVVNKDRVIGAALSAVSARTGTTVTAARSEIHFGSHLILTLDGVAISRPQGGSAHIGRLKALISYHSILIDRFTPLYGLILNRVDTILPVQRLETAPVTSLRQREMIGVEGAMSWLGQLERVAWRLAIVDATLRDADGTVLATNFDLHAFRHHADSSLWIIGFRSRLETAPVRGTEIAANLSAGAGGSLTQNQISRGHVWFWNLPLALFHGEGWRGAGTGQGSAQFTLFGTGATSGSADLGARGLVLSGPDLRAPLALGEYSLHVSFDASVQALTLKDLQLRRANQEIASGGAEISDPFAANPAVRLHLTGVAIDPAAVRGPLRLVRNLPAYVKAVLDRVTAGTVKIGEADLSASYKQLHDDPIEALRASLTLAASVIGGSFTLPAEYKLPAVSALSVQLRFAKSVLTATQGNARVGNSPIRAISARVDFTRGFDSVPYGVSFHADADIGELFGAAMLAMDRLNLKDRERIKSAGGRLAITADAAGVFDYDHLGMPVQYQIKVAANRFRFTVLDTPGPVQITRGSIVIAPHLMLVDHLMLAATGGDGVITGELGLEPSGMAVHHLTVEMHQMPAGLWLPLIVPPEDVELAGEIGGKIDVNSEPRDPASYLVTGKMVIARGELGFGFLRAPIRFQEATLTFGGHSMALDLPSAQLENKGLEFRLSVADLRHPTLRIDANSQALDLQVMRFIRLPWTPSGPPPKFPIPVAGHIEARSANLSKLVMSNVKADFTRDANTWRVYNMTAVSMKGGVKLDISGRAKDDWIHMKGKIRGMDLAQLFHLSSGVRRAPLRGALDVNADLWADSNTDFFRTLAGTASVGVRDGKIERMTLLSRLLGFINLKSWLTANFPDPTTTGLPFDQAAGKFKGEGGNFYTDDFLLQGPVMDITATGSVEVGTGNLDMDVGMFPFSTVNWLLGKIPLIGENVAGGTGNLLAGYFHVHGPVSDPSITPRPITSVAEFVKKTLGLPINILRPNTIK
jgi:AsmA-like C-terminal region